MLLDNLFAINSEIVLNALQSKKFIDDFASLNLNCVPQENVPAVKYIGSKYKEYIKLQVDEIVK